MAAKFEVKSGSRAGSRARVTSILRRLAGAATLLAVVVFATAAHAAGSFKLKTTTAGEVGGSWHLFVKLELGRPPITAHVPMKFLFTKEAVFERDLVDGHGDTPVTNQMVLTNQTPNVESLDVDFADASGKIFKGTNFDFSLARDRGYEAGIYKVEVRTTDGVNIGSAQRLTLNGDNPVVDRRSITFNASPKSKKIPTLGLDAGANGAPQNDDAPAQNADVAPSGSAAPFIPQDAYQKTPEEEVKTRPAGCGCVTAGGGMRAGDETALAGIAFFGLMLLASRRGRRA
jgi:hypothetical protein